MVTSDNIFPIHSAVGSMVAAGSTIGVTGGAVYASSVSDDAESKKIEDLEDEDEEEEPEVVNTSDLHLHLSSTLWSDNILMEYHTHVRSIFYKGKVPVSGI